MRMSSTTRNASRPSPPVGWVSLAAEGCSRAWRLRGPRRLRTGRTVAHGVRQAVGPHIGALTHAGRKAPADPGVPPEHSPCSPAFRPPHPRMRTVRLHPLPRRASPVGVRQVLHDLGLRAISTSQSGTAHEPQASPALRQRVRRAVQRSRPCTIDQMVQIVRGLEGRRLKYRELTQGDPGFIRFA